MDFALATELMRHKFIDHIVLIVRDIKRTASFYGKFLDKPIMQDNKQVAYRVGDAKLFFGLSYKKYKQCDKDTGGLNHLAFGVSSFKELKVLEESLNKSGIKNSGIIIGKHSKNEFIWFDDPDGYRLEFYCRSEKL